MNNNNELKARTKSALKWLFFPSIGRSGFSQTTQDMKNSTDSMVLFARDTIFSKNKKNKNLEYLEQIKDPKERFKQSMICHNVKKKDINDIEKEATFKFGLNFILMVLMAAYLIISHGGGFNTTGIQAFLTIIMSISLMALLVARTARSSFWLYQVKLRSLVGFDVWLKDYSAWLGGTPSKSNMTMMMIGLFVIAGAHPALADNTSLSTVSSWLNGGDGVVQKSDLALQWLIALFPGGASSSMTSIAGSTGTNDVFQPLFQVFNSIILAVASGMMAFQTVIGTIQTAHEGQVLGQRWNTAFAPVRICLGIGSLAPIKGYCLAQLIAIQVLFAGYAVANGIWDKYVDANLSGGYTVNTLPSLSSQGSIINNMLESDTCWQYVQQNSVVADSSLWHRLTRWTLSSDDTPSTVQTQTLAGNIVVDYGPLCGRLTFKPLKQETDLTANSDNSTSGASTAIGNIAINKSSAYQSGLNTNVSNLLSQVHNGGSGSLSEALVASVMPGSDSSKAQKLANAQTMYAGLLTAEASYNNNMQTLASQSVQSSTATAYTEFGIQAKKLGWASAGALNPVLMKLGATQLEAMQTSIPSYTPPDLSNIPENQRKDIADAIDNMKKLTNTETSSLISSGSTLVETNKTSDIIGNIFGSANEYMLSISNGSLMSGGALSTLNPMQTIQSQGQTYLIIGEIAYSLFLAALAVVGATDGAADGAGPLKVFTKATSMALKLPLISVIVPFMNSLIGSILIIGAIEAYVIPMVPYILWLYAILGCAAFAVEFVIAAPLAAFMHVRLDGDELIGHQQKPFYSLLFNGTMRPTLLLFGLIASNKVFSVIVAFMNSTYEMAALSANGDSLIGGIGIVANMAIAMYIHYNLAVKCLELINKVPHMVTQMVGIQDHFEDPSRSTDVIKGGVVGIGREGGQLAGSSMSSALNSRKTPQPIEKKDTTQTTTPED